MSELLEITTHYQVKYTNRDPVPIDAIVKSLLAYERLLSLTPKFIEKAYHGIQVVDVSVAVQSLESGSLLEDFAIRYVFKGQENFDQAKQVFDNMMQDNNALKLVVAAGVGAYMTYGVMSSMADNAPSIHIENNQHAIINIGGKAGLSEADIQAVLREVPDKKRLAKDAVLALSPAREDSSAGIEVDGFESLNISPEYIAEAPTEVLIPEPLEKIEMYQNVEIVIYASDRDKHNSGWAGMVPGIIDKRVKFEIGDHVKPTKLHGRTRVKADIDVISKFNKTKKGFIPYFVRVNQVN